MATPIFEPVSATQTRVLILNRTNGGCLTARHQIIEVGTRWKCSRRLWKIGRKYEALSYRWGDDNPTHTVLLNDQWIKIHQNLYDALQVLVEHRSGVAIWTDRLCIDQQNVEERALQIQIMIHIYHNAQHVWAWLGSACDGTADVASRMPLLHMIGLELVPPGRGEYISEHRLPQPETAFWNALNMVLFNSYFNRLWILQEAAVAKKVTFLVGPHEISWQSMLNVFSVADNLSDIDGFIFPSSEENYPNDAVFRARAYAQLTFRERVRRDVNAAVARFSDRIMQAATENPSSFSDLLPRRQTLVAKRLQRLMNIQRKQQCKEPKDRVLALLGLVKIVGHITLNLPRSLHHSTEQLFIEVFYILSSASNLSDLLTLASPNPDSGLALPSWCPDFGQRAAQHFNVTRIGDLRAGWQASRGNSAIQRGKDAKILKLTGMKVGKIIFTPKRPWQDITRNDFNELAFSFLPHAAANVNWIIECWDAVRQTLVSDIVENSSQSVVAGQSLSESELLDQFWRTLCVEKGDSFTTGDILIDISHYYQLMEALKEISPAPGHAGKILEDFPCSTRKLVVLLNWLLNDKTFFITEQGLFGLGPPNMSVGDVLWLFRGARLLSILYGPVSMSSSDESTGPSDCDYWKYRGEAFVSAIMHGEAETQSEKFGAEFAEVDLI